MVLVPMVSVLYVLREELPESSLSRALSCIVLRAPGPSFVPRSRSQLRDRGLDFLESLDRVELSSGWSPSAGGQ